MSIQEIPLNNYPSFLPPVGSSNLNSNSYNINTPNVTVNIAPVITTIWNGVKIASDFTWNQLIVPVALETWDYTKVIAQGTWQGIKEGTVEIWTGQPYRTNYQANVYYDPYLAGGGSRLPLSTAPNAKGKAITESIKALQDDPKNWGNWNALLNATAASTFNIGALADLSDGYFGYSKTVSLWDELKEETTSGWNVFESDRTIDGELAFMNSLYSGDYSDRRVERGLDRTIPIPLVENQPIIDGISGPILSNNLMSFENDVIIPIREKYTNNITTENTSSRWGLDAGKDPSITLDENITTGSITDYRLSGKIERTVPGPNGGTISVDNGLLDLEQRGNKEFDSDSSNRVLLEKIEQKRSGAVEYLLNSGTDFMKNMFDVALLSWSEKENSYKNFFETVVESSALGENFPQIIDGSMFMIRTGSINVPQMESDTFELKIGFETVKKIRSKVKYERKAALNILLDEPLYFLGLFNFLSNNNSIIFNNITPTKRYPINFTTFSTNKTISENIKNKNIRVDLIIKHQQLNNYPILTNLNNNWRLDSNINVKGFAGLMSKEMPLWYFEDINFLGQGDSLVFNREDSTTTSMSFPFLFKRCIKVDRQFRHGTEQNIQFNNGEKKELSIIQEESLPGEILNQSNQYWYYGEL